MSSWFVTASPRPAFADKRQPQEARLRLFTFPYAGRGASLFTPWRRALPDWIELIAGQLPGREIRIGEPALTRMDDIVARMVGEIQPYLDRPFVFFGHSMGALVSYELARALRRGGGPAPLALLLSGRQAPVLPNPQPHLHGLQDAPFIEAVRARYDGIPQALLDEPDVIEMLLPTLKRDVESIETHVHRSEEPLPLPFHLYGGDDDPQVSREALEAWMPLSSRISTIQLFPGGHFYLHPRQDDLLQAICRDMARLLPLEGVSDKSAESSDQRAAGG